MNASAPFFIDTSAGRLFACYHEAQVWPPRDVAFLICQPQGQEYLRSHRALERLAGMLAQQGYSTLRFDYSGSGDSSGEDETGTLDQWKSEIAAMSEELSLRSGASTVGLIGLRLGATLAWQVATSGAVDPAALVLWEPVLNGVAYLDANERRFREASFRYAIAVNESARADGAKPVNGFVLGSEMIAQMQKVNLLDTSDRSHCPTLVIESGDDAGVAIFAKALEADSPQTVHRCVDSFVLWTEDVDKGLVPMRVLSEIVNWISDTFPS